jgi:hypothetical protein
MLPFDEGAQSLVGRRRHRSGLLKLHAGLGAPRRRRRRRRPAVGADLARASLDSVLCIAGSVEVRTRLSTVAFKRGNWSMSAVAERI